LCLPVLETQGGDFDFDFDFHERSTRFPSVPVSVQSIVTQSRQLPPLQSHSEESCSTSNPLAFLPTLCAPDSDEYSEASRRVSIRSKQVASYLGLIPREHSSGGRQKLGAITKQGNRILRMLLGEAAQSAVRLDPEFRREYLHRCHSKPRGVPKVAAARNLAVRLYWMLRTQTTYPEIVRIESSPRVPLVGLHPSTPKSGAPGTPAS
jgi:transposase IS116/IS110/IS902 family protein